MAVVNSILGNLLLFILVFGMSATVEIDRMRQQFQNIKALSTGILCQFFLLPFLGFIVVRFLDLPEPLGLTLLVVTSSPGGSYSNWWCSVFNADLALSVTMTAVSTILSIIFLPANLLLYTRFSYHGDVMAALDWSSIFIALGIVILAIVAGLFASYQTNQGAVGEDKRNWKKMANHMGNFAGKRRRRRVCVSTKCHTFCPQPSVFSILGFSLILFSVLLSNSGDADTKVWSRDWTFYVGVASPCLGGLIIANIISTLCQLRRPERVTVAIECCYQNVSRRARFRPLFGNATLKPQTMLPFFSSAAHLV